MLVSSLWVAFIDSSFQVSNIFSPSETVRIIWHLLPSLPSCHLLQISSLFPNHQSVPAGPLTSQLGTCPLKQQQRPWPRAPSGTPGFDQRLFELQSHVREERKASQGRTPGLHVSMPPCPGQKLISEIADSQILCTEGKRWCWQYTAKEEAVILGGGNPADGDLLPQKRTYG